MENLIDLTENELLDITAGWNVIEYIVMGVAYVSGSLTKSLHDIEPQVYQRW